MAERAVNFRNPNFEREPETAVVTITRREPKQAYQALQIGFVALPLIAGLDKFAYLLADWTQYLAPVFPRATGITPTTFMGIVGVLEIIAGIGVALRPKIFAYVVSGWMAAIVLNLLILGQHYDIALRDIGLAIGAFALGKLSQVFWVEPTRPVKVIPPIDRSRVIGLESNFP